jgi:hypothetical protein
MKFKFLTTFLVFFSISFAQWMPSPVPPHINGFFVQPMLGYGIPDYRGNFRTQEHYDDWIKSMADVGATMLFIQWVGHYEENMGWFADAYGGSSHGDFFYYHHNLTPINGIPVNSWMPAIEAWTGSNITPIQRMLDAGQKNGVDIWLGLYLSEKGQFNWWNAVSNNNITAADSATFRYHVERNVALVQDLIAQYGDHPALGGFYYPIEIANLGFEKEENWDLLAWILDSVATEVHRLSDKRLAISPFFNVRLTNAQEWGRMWDYVLARSAIDIIILQDGVGVEPQTANQISPFFEAVAKASRNNDKEFWGNVELFTNTSGDRGVMQAKPATINEVLSRLNEIEETLRHTQTATTTFVCFSFLSMDPFVERTPFDDQYPLSARRQLYNDYKEFYEKYVKWDHNSINPNRARQSSRRNYRISVSGANISVSGLQRPTPYQIITPNGKVVSHGIAENGAVINSQLTSAGVYIFMLMSRDGTPIRQKILNRR